MRITNVNLPVELQSVDNWASRRNNPLYPSQGEGWFFFYIIIWYWVTFEIKVCPHDKIHSSQGHGGVHLWLFCPFLSSYLVLCIDTPSSLTYFSSLIYVTSWCFLQPPQFKILISLFYHIKMYRLHLKSPQKIPIGQLSLLGKISSLGSPLFIEQICILLHQ